MNITIDEDSCIGCSVCVDVCGDHALTMEGEYPVFNAEKCTGCGQCLAGLCPVDAMHS